MSDTNKCGICGIDIPLTHAVLGGFIGGKLYVICLSHEGTPEYKKWVEEMIEDSAEKEGGSHDGESKV